MADPPPDAKTVKFEAAVRRTHIAGLAPDRVELP
jgi:hypothetical protein